MKHYVIVFNVILDSSNFDELLLLCDKWDLSSFKKHIQDYFINNHIHGIRNIRVLTQQHFRLLVLADKYNLSEFCHSMLNQAQGIDDGCFKPYSEIGGSRFESYWEKARLELQYEILKIFAITGFQKYPECTMVEVGVMELNAIFNFLDLILYEDKVLDHSSKTLYQKETSAGNSCSDVKRPKRTSIHKMCIFEDDDVIVKVDEHNIYMNSITLTVNSPVFNAC